MTKIYARKRLLMQSGFSMVEILIALFVLSIGFIGVLSLFPVGLDATKRMVQDSTALELVKTAYTYAKIQAGKSGILQPSRSAAAKPPQADGEVQQTPTGNNISVTVDRGDLAGTWSPGGTWLVITSGKAEGKIYQVSDVSASGITCSNADFAKDGVRQGDKFKLISDAQLPDMTLVFYNDPALASTLQRRQFMPVRLDTEPGSTYSCSYIIGPLEEGLASLDIFIYKNFDPARGYEGNDPPVQRYSTIIALKDPDAPTGSTGNPG